MKKILLPFQLFRLEMRQSILWILFTIIGGLLGIFFNTWNHITPDVKIYQALMFEFSVNSFYTYSIVLIACTIGSLIMKMDSDKILLYSGHKVWLLVSLVILLLVGTVLCLSPNKINDQFLFQFIFFILTVAVAIYGFCVINMDRHPDVFNVLQEKFSQDEAKRIMRMVKKATVVNKDKKGNKI